MQQLSATSAFVGGEIVGPTRVTWDVEGVITHVEPVVAADADLDLLMAPGFIDIQVNGKGDVNVATADDEQWARIDEMLLGTGVTSWCPTLISAPFAELTESLQTIDRQMRRELDTTARSSVLGAHLEGPFLGAAPGAHHRRSIVPIDLEWLRQLPRSVMLMTFGAELDDVEEAMRVLVSMGVTVSIGHTRATDAALVQAKKSGARIFTHLFNAMSGVHHRDHGVALVALTDDDMFASIIVDMEHVSKRAVQLAFRAKPGKMILITDSVQGSGANAPRLADGILAGSVLSMDQAIRNCVQRCEIPLSVALASATSRPAEALGLSDRGNLVVGQRADLVLLSQSLEVRKTISRGLLYRPSRTTIAI